MTTLNYVELKIEFLKKQKIIDKQAVIEHAAKRYNKQQENRSKKEIIINAFVGG